MTYGVRGVHSRMIGWGAMGVLDRQSLRGETRNRRLGRNRLAMRDRRRLPRTGAGERRRPDRGLRDPAPRRSARRGRFGRRVRGLGDQLGTLVHGLGRLLVFLVLAPFVALRLLVRPRELVERLREAPARMRSAAKRVRLESRDPDTVPGRVLETARISAWFLQEELADMRDGVPTAQALKTDLRDGTRGVLDTVGGAIGLRENGDGRTVGDRLFAAMAAGLIIGTVAVGAFVGTHNAVEELKTSDTMALTSVTVLGLDRVAEDTALGLLPRTGTNLLELELDRLAVGLEELPWVDDVTVERDLATRTLEVRVVEHRPALLLAGPSLRLLDEQGHAFKVREAGEPADLPVLTGVPHVDGEPDEEALVAATAGALEILHALGPGRALGQHGVSEIHWEGEAGWSVVTRDGLPIHLGERDFGARLTRVERAVTSGRLPLDAIASIDAGLRDRLVAVPRARKSARRAVKKVLESQPVPKRDRARLLHLERIQGDPDEDLFGGFGDVDL